MSTEHHSHEHHSHEHHSHDFAKANQEHFDHDVQMQKNYENSQWIDLSRQVGRSLVESHKDLFTKETTVLDFACGPGLVAAEILPHVRSILGVDISQGMVDTFNTRAETVGAPAESMHAVRGELKGTDAELDGRKFDLAICTAAYHHIDDVDAATRMLASFLVPGGSLLVVDFVKMETDGPLGGEAYKHINAHKGFTEAEMRAMFEGAGLAGFEIKPMGGAEILGLPMKFFVARGVKA